MKQAKALWCMCLALLLTACSPDHSQQQKIASASQQVASETKNYEQPASETASELTASQAQLLDRVTDIMQGSGSDKTESLPAFADKQQYQADLAEIRTLLQTFDKELFERRPQINASLKAAGSDVAKIKQAMSEENQYFREQTERLRQLQPTDVRGKAVLAKLLRSRDLASQSIEISINSPDHLDKTGAMIEESSMLELEVLGELAEHNQK